MFNDSDDEAEVSAKMSEEVPESPLHPTAEIVAEAVAAAEAKEKTPPRERRPSSVAQSPVPRLLSGRLAIVYEVLTRRRQLFA